MRRKVYFVSRSIAELLFPIKDCALISISNSLSHPAQIKPGWEHIKRVYFVDGSYTHSDILTAGVNFKKDYASYINREIAIQIRQFIHEIIGAGINSIVVHCNAGESRSGAVAKYIAETYDFVPSNRINTDHPIKDWADLFSKSNPTVFNLLKKPNYYDNALEMVESRQQPKSDSLRSIVGKMKNLFGPG
jgi:hypothetical protein